MHLSTEPVEVRGIGSLIPPEAAITGCCKPPDMVLGTKFRSILSTTGAISPAQKCILPASDREQRVSTEVLIFVITLAFAVFFFNSA